MKYIILERNLGDIKQYIPIIFPNELVHSDIATALIQHTQYKFETVVISAGDIQLNEINTSGKSETLKLTSQPNDADLIINFDYEHGII